jgi:hypothetical protein
MLSREASQRLPTAYYIVRSEIYSFQVEVIHLLQVEISAPVNGCHSPQIYFRRGGQTGREKYSATLRVAVRARAAYKEFPDCSWDPCSETMVDMQAWSKVYI